MDEQNPAPPQSRRGRRKALRKPLRQRGGPAVGDVAEPAELECRGDERASCRAKRVKARVIVERLAYRERRGEDWAIGREAEHPPRRRRARRGTRDGERAPRGGGQSLPAG